MDFSVDLAIMPLLAITVVLILLFLHVLLVYIHTRKESHKYFIVFLVILVLISLNIYKYINGYPIVFWSKIFAISLIVYLGLVLSNMINLDKKLNIEVLAIGISLVLLFIIILLDEIISGFIAIIIMIPLGILLIRISLTRHRFLLIRGIFILVMGVFILIGVTTGNYAAVLLFSIFLLLAVIYEVCIYFTSIIELLKTISMQSIKDPLTKLYNKFYLLNKLDNLLGKEELKIMFIDIDNFKQINDSNGHNFGDELLRKVSSILLKETSNFGFSARYGGEELVTVLLSGEVDKIAEKFRARVEKELSITVSIGLSDSLEDKFDDSIGLLNLADERMYHAKKTGKNKVIKKI